MVNILTENTDCQWEWVDVIDPKPGELEELASRYNLHSSWVQDALQPRHLPKYERLNNIVFAIIRVFDQEIGEAGDMVQDLTNKIAIFYSGTYLITVHISNYTFINKLKENYIQPNTGETPFGLFIQLVKESLISFEEPALKLAKDLDFFESEVFLRKRSNIPLTNNIYWLKRKAEVSKRLLNLSKVVLDNASRDMGNDPQVQDMHDLFLRVFTMYEEVDNSTYNLLNIYIGLTSQRTNEVMRILTIISVFFMPLTFIVGIYGMNFRYMPEINHKLGYPLTWAVMLLITLGIFIWFKRKGWL